MHLLFELDREGGLDRERALATEWLETNGLGDYACSTLLMCPTRRQHGLLVARPNGSEKRHVFLSRMEETVRTGEDELYLTTTGYPGTWAPPAAEQLERFELAPHPVSLHRSEEVELERSLQMVRGEKAVLLRYRRVGGDADAESLLELRPFLPYREADALTVANDAITGAHERTAEGVALRPYPGLPALHVTVGGDFDYAPDPHWYENVDLPRDRARGYPAREDHFTPGILRVPLRRGAHVTVAVSLDGPIEDPAAAWAREARRRTKSLNALGIGADPGPADRLAAGAADFLVEDGGRLGIDAGYPWFVEWGRDTFIALPGLTLALGDLRSCERVLTESLEYLRDGLLPNVFGTSRETSHYGSVDASLWYARAVLLYERAGGSAKRIRSEYLPALLEIAECYREGTGLGIAADDGGLIRAGSDELNATWMDARTSAGPVTPRAGCAVEINALWYSLLEHVERLLDRKSDRAAKKEWRERRLAAKRTFLERFWLEERGHLADVWNEGRVDARVRPNMVLAAALEYSPLVKAQRRGVVERAEADLLTPRGLRTLAPDAEGYVGRYEGAPEERDRAYHQGTVWPWLFGFHVEASLRALGSRKPVRRALRAVWDEIVSELDRTGLGHVSEVFDGDEPRRPEGTIAQAWNTSELLRAHVLLEKGIEKGRP